MDEKQLSLTWNNHGSTYKSMFNVLRQKNILTDITLACDGRQFSAHQLVLATCSDYFQSILSSVSRNGGGSCGGGGGHPIVYLRGVPAQEMHAMLEFMYTGQARLPQSEVKALMETAKALQIKGLGVMPEEEENEKGLKEEQHELGSWGTKNQPCINSTNRTPKCNGKKNVDSQDLLKKNKSTPVVRKIEVVDSNQSRKRPLLVDVPKNEAHNCKSSPKNISTYHDSSTAGKALSPKRRKTSISHENSLSVMSLNHFNSPRRDHSYQGQHGVSPQVSDATKALALNNTMTDRDTLAELISVKSEPNFLQVGQDNELSQGPFCSNLESILDYNESKESKVYQNASRSTKPHSRNGLQTHSRKTPSKSTNDASGCLLKLQESPNPSSDQSLSCVNSLSQDHPNGDWRPTNGQAGERDNRASLLHDGSVMSLEDENGSFMAPGVDESSLGRSQPSLSDDGPGDDDCTVLTGNEAHENPSEVLLGDVEEGVGLAAASFEEEAQLYLEAFTRSAGLSKNSLKLPHEEPLAPSALSIREPSAPSVGVPEDALTANNCPPELPFLPAGDAVEDAENRPYVCPICRKCFSKAAILKRHHLAHFRPYSCQLCQRSFTRREVLAEHLQEHSGADMRLPCPVCAMTIKRKRNLQAHIKVKHPDYYRHRLASNLAIC